MSRDDCDGCDLDRRWERMLDEKRLLIIALALGILAGFGGGWIAGRFLDRDRDVVIQEIYQFEDRRWDVAAEHVTIIQPVPDPGAKGGKE
jgi:hypothetical protein